MLAQGMRGPWAGGVAGEDTFPRPRPGGAISLSRAHLAKGHVARGFRAWRGGQIRAVCLRQVLGVSEYQPDRERPAYESVKMIWVQFIFQARSGGISRCNLWFELLHRCG